MKYRPIMEAVLQFLSTCCVLMAFACILVGLFVGWHILLGFAVYAALAGVLYIISIYFRGKTRELDEF